MRARISRVHHPVTALGPGTRAGIWFQGCSIGCDGCMSRDTWDKEAGVEAEVSELVGWVQSLPDAELDGVTISGGEPFEQPEALDQLLDGIGSCARRASGELDVLCYSGFAHRRLRRFYPGLLAKVDALVAGPYVRSRPTNLIWRGSANQEIVTLTELGRARYQEFVGLEPARTPIQVSVEPDVVRYVGVPRSGDMARLETRLAELGIELGASSWQA